MKTPQAMKTQQAIEQILKPGRVMGIVSARSLKDATINRSQVKIGTGF
jgi:hypothetical protein